MKYYAGIGSRETPNKILGAMALLADWLGSEGFTLRSGGAEGADMAFEMGADRLSYDKEIFLPWKGFNGNNSKLYIIGPRAFDIAEEIHPAWGRLNYGARLLQARNIHQVLGDTLDKPVNFIICWTKGASGSGGTGQAIRLANKLGIKVFDLGEDDLRYNDLSELDYFNLYKDKITNYFK